MQPCKRYHSYDCGLTISLCNIQMRTMNSYSLALSFNAFIVGRISDAVGIMTYCGLLNLYLILWKELKCLAVSIRVSEGERERAKITQKNVWNSVIESIIERVRRCLRNQDSADH